MEKKQLINIQIALFLKDNISNLEELSLEIKKKLDGGQTQYLPVPDFPNELVEGMPKLVIKYSDFFIQIYRKRLDIFFNNELNIFTTVSEITSVLNTLSFKIGRVGFVKRFFIEQSVDFLYKILNEEIYKENIKEIGIRINRLKKIDLYDCNSIEKIDPGGYIENNIEKKGFIILRDVNTLQEQSDVYLFNEDNIDSFVKLMNKEANTIEFLND